MTMTFLPPLTLEERRTLLGLARAAVEARIDGGSPPSIPSGTPRLQERQGAFVTLHVGGRLHGCIGIVEPIRPLVDNVAQCAAAAAAEDPRFPPLTPAELADLTLEVTALAPPVRVDDPGTITVGRHGLLVEFEERRGVLLPQVAVEQGWDVPTFVRETLRKAGLPPDALRRGTAILLAFEAEVFSERSVESPEATGSAPGSPPRSPAPTG